MLMLCWMPANQAYVFKTRADSICDVNGQYVFHTRQAAVDAAKACGLIVCKDGVVIVEPGKGF